MKALQITQPRTFSVVQIPEPYLEVDNSSQILVRAVWFSMRGSDIPFIAGANALKHTLASSHIPSIGACLSMNAWAS